MPEDPKYTRRPFPANTLREAASLAQAIQDKNNGRPMNRVLLANAIGRKPASSDYKALLSSANKYGLSVGSEKAESIALTPLGESLTRPRADAERFAVLKRSATTPELFQKIYEHYNNGKLPQGDFFLNVLERDFKVPRDRCAECAAILVDNGRYAELLRELQGTLYVISASEVGGTSEVQIADDSEIPETIHDGMSLEDTEVPTSSPVPHEERNIFLGHGKNRKPLEQLEHVLDQFKVGYKVATDEPQQARPISVKVAETMKACHSAILIFTADEQFTDSEGKIIWRPSENVVYELGAASVLYDNRIVIFKEEGVEFPTNFRDLGYISFEKDRLDAKGLDLVKELVALGLVRVSAA